MYVLLLAGNRMGVLFWGAPILQREELIDECG